MKELETRTLDLDGVSEWLWVKKDTGAWDGPHKDWPIHKALIEKHVGR